MKLTAALIVSLTVVSSVAAQTSPLSTLAHLPAANPTVRHILGLDAAKRNATGMLTLQDGVLEFKPDKVDNEARNKNESRVPVASIDDVFIGTETTQDRGKTARVLKTAAIAAPYDTGAALSILMRAKVDILTVAFHDSEGGLHGAIFALPIGQAKPLREQLIQAGAHASQVEK